MSKNLCTGLGEIRIVSAHEIRVKRIWWAESVEAGDNLLSFLNGCGLRFCNEWPSTVPAEQIDQSQYTDLDSFLAIENERESQAAAKAFILKYQLERDTIAAPSRDGGRL
jgi:hypothetical protein